MEQALRHCKYGCGIELGQFSTKENKFLESDQKTLHTRERCQSLKMTSKEVTNGHEGFCTKWHESYKVLNPYWKCCPYCCDNLEDDTK